MSVKAVMGLEWAINSLKNAFRSTGTRQRRLVVEFASFFFFSRGGGMGDMQQVSAARFRDERKKCHSF